MIRKIPRARFTAPALHLVLFGITWLLARISSQPILEGPASFPLGVLFFADFPISAIASSVMFMSARLAWYAITLWGVLGTFWWYALGLSIEAWLRRLAKRQVS